MGYGNIHETPSERDKKAVGGAEYALSGESMVRKIPKDHQGLYLSDPFSHGKQSHISEEKEDVSRHLAQRGMRQVQRLYSLCKKVK